MAFRRPDKPSRVSEHTDDEDTLASLDLYIETLEADKREEKTWLPPPSPLHASDSNYDIYSGLDCSPTHDSLSRGLLHSTVAHKLQQSELSEDRPFASVKESKQPGGEGCRGGKEAAGLTVPRSSQSPTISSSSLTLKESALADSPLVCPGACGKERESSQTQGQEPSCGLGGTKPPQKCLEKATAGKSHGDSQPVLAGTQKDYTDLLDKYRILRSNMLSLLRTAQTELQSKSNTISQLRAAAEAHKCSKTGRAEKAPRVTVVNSSMQTEPSCLSTSHPKSSDKDRKKVSGRNVGCQTNAPSVCHTSLQTEVTQSSDRQTQTGSSSLKSSAVQTDSCVLTASEMQTETPDILSASVQTSPTCCQEVSTQSSAVPTDSKSVQANLQQTEIQQTEEAVPLVQMTLAKDVRFTSSEPDAERHTSTKEAGRGVKSSGVPVTKDTKRGVKSSGTTVTETKQGAQSCGTTVASETEQGAQKSSSNTTVKETDRGVGSSGVTAAESQTAIDPQESRRHGPRPKKRRRSTSPRSSSGNRGGMGDGCWTVKRAAGYNRSTSVDSPLMASTPKESFSHCSTQSHPLDHAHKDPLCAADTVSSSAAFLFPSSAPELPPVLREAGGDEEMVSAALSPSSASTLVVQEETGGDLEMGSSVCPLPSKQGGDGFVPVVREEEEAAAPDKDETVEIKRMDSSDSVHVSASSAGGTRAEGTAGMPGNRRESGISGADWSLGNGRLDHDPGAASSMVAASKDAQKASSDASSPTELTAGKVASKDAVNATRGANSPTELTAGKVASKDAVNATRGSSSPREPKVYRLPTPLRLPQSSQPCTPYLSPIEVAPAPHPDQLKETTGPFAKVKGHAWRRKLLLWTDYSHKRMSRRQEIDAVHSGSRSPKIYVWERHISDRCDLDGGVYVQEHADPFEDFKDYSQSALLPERAQEHRSEVDREESSDRASKERSLPFQSGMSVEDTDDTPGNHREPGLSVEGLTGLSGDNREPSISVGDYGTTKEMLVSDEGCVSTGFLSCLVETNVGGTGGVKIQTAIDEERVVNVVDVAVPSLDTLHVEKKGKRKRKKSRKDKHGSGAQEEKRNKSVKEKKRNRKSVEKKGVGKKQDNPETVSENKDVPEQLEQDDSDACSFADMCERDSQQLHESQQMNPLTLNTDDNSDLLAENTPDLNTNSNCDLLAENTPDVLDSRMSEGEGGDQEGEDEQLASTCESDVSVRTYNTDVEDLSPMKLHRHPLLDAMGPPLDSISENIELAHSDGERSDIGPDDPTQDLSPNVQPPSDFVDIALDSDRRKKMSRENAGESQNTLVPVSVSEKDNNFSEKSTETPVPYASRPLNDCTIVATASDDEVFVSKAQQNAITSWMEDSDSDLNTSIHSPGRNQLPVTPDKALVSETHQDTTTKSWKENADIDPSVAGQALHVTPVKRRKLPSISAEVEDILSRQSQTTKPTARPSLLSSPSLIWSPDKTMGLPEPISSHTFHKFAGFSVVGKARRRITQDCVALDSESERLAKRSSKDAGRSKRRSASVDGFFEEKAEQPSEHPSAFSSASLQVNADVESCSTWQQELQKMSQPTEASGAQDDGVRSVGLRAEEKDAVTVENPQRHGDSNNLPLFGYPSPSSTRKGLPKRAFCYKRTPMFLVSSSSSSTSATTSESVSATSILSSSSSSSLIAVNQRPSVSSKSGQHSWNSAQACKSALPSRSAGDVVEERSEPESKPCSFNAAAVVKERSVPESIHSSQLPRISGVVVAKERSVPESQKFAQTLHSTGAVVKEGFVPEMTGLCSALGATEKASAAGLAVYPVHSSSVVSNVASTNSSLLAGETDDASDGENNSSKSRESERPSGSADNGPIPHGSKRKPGWGVPALLSESASFESAESEALISFPGVSTNTNSGLSIANETLEEGEIRTDDDFSSSAIEPEEPCPTQISKPPVLRRFGDGKTISTDLRKVLQDKRQQSERRERSSTSKETRELGDINPNSANKCIDAKSTHSKRERKKTTAAERKQNREKTSDTAKSSKEKSEEDRETEALKHKIRAKQDELRRLIVSQQGKDDVSLTQDKPSLTLTNYKIPKRGKKSEAGSVETANSNCNKHEKRVTTQLEKRTKSNHHENDQAGRRDRHQSNHPKESEESHASRTSVSGASSRPHKNSVIVNPSPQEIQDSTSKTVTLSGQSSKSVVLTGQCRQEIPDSIISKARSASDHSSLSDDTGVAPDPSPGEGQAVSLAASAAEDFSQDPAHCPSPSGSILSLQSDSEPSGANRTRVFDYFRDPDKLRPQVREVGDDEVEAERSDDDGGNRSECSDDEGKDSDSSDEDDDNGDDSDDHRQTMDDSDTDRRYVDGKSGNAQDEESSVDKEGSDGSGVHASNTAEQQQQQHSGCSSEDEASSGSDTDSDRRDPSDEESDDSDTESNHCDDDNRAAADNDEAASSGFELVLKAGQSRQQTPRINGGTSGSNQTSGQTRQGKNPMTGPAESGSSLTAAAPLAVNTEPFVDCLSLDAFGLGDSHSFLDEKQRTPRVSGGDSTGGLRKNRISTSGSNRASGQTRQGKNPMTGPAESGSSSLTAAPLAVNTEPSVDCLSLDAFGLDDTHSFLDESDMSLSKSRHVSEQSKPLAAKASQSRAVGRKVADTFGSQSVKSSQRLDEEGARRTGPAVIASSTHGKNSGAEEKTQQKLSVESHSLQLSQPSVTSDKDPSGANNRPQAKRRQRSHSKDRGPEEEGLKRKRSASRSRHGSGGSHEGSSQAECGQSKPGCADSEQARRRSSSSCSSKENDRAGGKVKPSQTSESGKKHDDKRGEEEDKKQGRMSGREKYSSHHHDRRRASYSPASEDSHRRTPVSHQSKPCQCCDHRPVSPRRRSRSPPPRSRHEKVAAVKHRHSNAHVRSMSRSPEHRHSKALASRRPENTHTYARARMASRSPEHRKSKGPQTSHSPEHRHARRSSWSPSRSLGAARGRRFGGHQNRRHQRSRSRSRDRDVWRPNWNNHRHGPLSHRLGKGGDERAHVCGCDQCLTSRSQACRLACCSTGSRRRSRSRSPSQRCGKPCCSDVRQEFDGHPKRPRRH